ncbi:hypothetical protein V7S43_004069 [Phytophthora oleae]|uniref:BZIP domain-containing protein n=1 Tax=Phytophthora oleae TaxID=2107226 RepID=A0ABD3FZ06_9STRA
MALMDEDTCIPGSAVPEGVQLLDMFLKDMNALDASQSKTIESGPKQQVDANANETHNSAHTRPFGPFVTCERDENVQLNRAATLTTRKKKYSWLRRKEELHNLRQQTQAMETHVIFLLQRQNKQARCGFSQKWKGVATTQQRRLEKAQQENSELKDKVRAYKQLLGALQAAITDVSLQEQVASITPTNSIQAAIEELQSFQNDNESSGIFTTLETIVDHRFCELHSILDELQQNSTTVNNVEVQICNGDDGTIAAMEYKCAQVLPFDDVAASKAKTPTPPVRVLCCT